MTITQRATDDSAEVLAAAKRARGADRTALRERVIRRHVPLARSLASRYAGRGIATDDLQQVACLGLVKAVNGYDPQRSSEFLSYAVPTVRGELRRHFRDAGWTVRPPRRIQELQARVVAAQGELSQRLERPPTPEELADELGAKVEDVVESLTAEGCFVPLSLDAEDANGSGTVGGDLGAPDGEFLRLENRIVLQDALRTLADRDRDIVRMRFVEDLTQEQIGERVGVTQMQVSRLLSRILRDLRVELTGAAAV